MKHEITINKWEEVAYRLSLKGADRGQTSANPSTRLLLRLIEGERRGETENGVANPAACSV